MIINETKFLLPSDNYIEVESTKNTIVIGHTGNRDMRHVTGWLHRYHNKYKRTAAFTIDAAGSVYKHFDPKYQSRFFNDTEMDSKTIVILLENEGWLRKDTVKNEFLTWIGDIYNKESGVVIKKWRGQTLWVPYTDEQFEATVELVGHLCKEFKMPINPIGHNTKLDSLLENNNVLYRSNLHKEYTDISPAWDFELFKIKLENKKQNNETKH